MSQFSLKVLKDLEHPDGRIFSVGHDCNSLDLFEASELLFEYPDNFEGANEVTVELKSDPGKIAHYAAAASRKKADGLQGSLKAVKK